MNKKLSYPVLYANCITVRGHQRSLICDLQMGTFEFIPNSLHEIITKYFHLTREEIDEEFPTYSDTLEEYFDFLSSKKMIFFTNNPMNFPKLSLAWDEPAFISNAIIDVGFQEKIDFGLVFNDLSDLGCKFLQMRYYNEIDLAQVDKVLNLLERKRILYIDILLKKTEYHTLEELRKFCKRHQRVMNLYIHSAEKDEVLYNSPKNWGNIYAIKQSIDGSIHCGIVVPSYFTTNLPTFTEAQQHNTCLNRKISIDTEGYIRNCPSMKEHYGNIKDTTLQDALAHPDFKKYWFVNKDQISVCKDCEFRYICTDCRAYIENPEDMYSKPLKCGYNPYTCEWEEWSTNPLKQKAIEHYEMREMVSKS